MEPDDKLAVSFPLKPGDRIKFRASCDFRWQVRKIIGLDMFGRALVRHRGWSEFIVLDKDIIEHYPQQEDAA